jgi:hypothetical protein
MVHIIISVGQVFYGFPDVYCGDPNGEGWYDIWSEKLQNEPNTCKDCIRLRNENLKNLSERLSDMGKSNE